VTENEKKSAEIETNAKPEKTKKEKKGKAKDSWRGFKSETKKIVWPTWKQVLKGTGVVLVVVIICAVAIGALDLTFSKGMDALINLFKK
jgi:preprotein translocase subunit SecE